MAGLGRKDVGALGEISEENYDAPGHYDPHGLHY